MPSSASRLPPAVALTVEASARLGLEVEILDPEFGFLFELRGRGVSRVLLGGISPLNDKVATRITGDKHYTGVILERAGFRVPRSMRCLAPTFFANPEYQGRVGIAPGLAFAAEQGYPIMVKPNRGSKGRGVVAVQDADHLVRAIESVFDFDAVALVQPIIPLPDLRLNFLDGEYLLGYQRSSRRVTGDGTRTVRELVAASDERFRDEQTWQGVEYEFDQDEIPEPGQEVVLSGAVLNLNSWAEARLIEDVPDRWMRHCLRIGEALGLRHFGIDFRGASLDEDPGRSTVIEVNASPSLLSLVRLGWSEQAVAAQARVLEAIIETPGPGRDLPGPGPE